MKTTKKENRGGAEGAEKIKPKTATALAFSTMSDGMAEQVPASIGDFVISMRGMIKGCRNRRDLKQAMMAFKRALIAAQKFEAAAAVRDLMVKAGLQ